MASKIKTRRPARKLTDSPRTDRSRTELARAQRIAEIETLMAGPYTKPEIMRMMAEQHGIAERTVRLDVAAIEQEWIKADVEDSKLRHATAIRAWMRRVRLCEAAEEQQAANYALDRLHKITGEFAPTKLEVSGTVSMDVKIEALVATLDVALDDEGKRCLAIVQAQLEAARARGLLPSGDEVAAVAAKDVS